MGKKKKGKQNFNLSKNTISTKSKKLNPFELKINREKHDVLGRKKRNESSFRGASKRMGIQKRKNTLLKEYTTRKKCNNFLDRRINSKNKEMSYKTFKKLRHNKSLFNLNDDEEELTHFGQNISELETFEKFDDIDDDDDDDAKLKDDFVKEAHFGGFLTEKKKDEVVKSRKELIQEIIAESKRKKYEKQTERENTIEMTEKLDNDWKSLQQLISKVKQKTVEEEHKLMNSYDLTVNELKFEIKAKASDPLKKPEQKELEEKKRLRELENERLVRMKGLISDDIHKSNYFSADSITTPSIKKLKIGSSEITPSDERSDNDNEEDISEKNVTNQETNDLAINTKIIPTTLSAFLEMIPEEENLSLVLKDIISNLKNFNNKNKYEMFFKVLLEYTCIIADNGNLNLLDILIPYLHELTQLSPKGTTHHFLSVLKNAEETFQKVCENKNRAMFPNFTTIIILKLCDILYPTSDFRHPVTTPATILLMRILTECRVRTIQEVLCGLFVCGIALDYVSFSKRFLPEALNFLLKLIFSTSKEMYPSAFKLIKFDLNLSNSFNDDIPVLKMSDIRRLTREVDDCLKIQVIKTIVDITTKFLELYSEYPSGVELFSTIKKSKLLQDTHYYPESLKQNIEKLITLTQSVNNKKFLKQRKEPVKCLRFLEPRMEEKFEGRKIHKGSKNKLEKDKLRYQYKRELKGAIKEIRNDNQFLANIRLNEVLERDAERKQKVKELYRELAMQESDFKSLKKEKK